MTVYLVGAGPGDPGLLTVRAADLIARADVILHDRLIPPEALAGPDVARAVLGQQLGRGVVVDHVAGLPRVIGSGQATAPPAPGGRVSVGGIPDGPRPAGVGAAVVGAVAGWHPPNVIPWPGRPD